MVYNDNVLFNVTKIEKTQIIKNRINFLPHQNLTMIRNATCRVEKFRHEISENGDIRHDNNYFSLERKDPDVKNSIINLNDSAHEKRKNHTNKRTIQNERLLLADSSRNGRADPSFRSLQYLSCRRKRALKSPYLTE